MPVAHLNSQPSLAQLEKVAADFKSEGRTLWMLSGLPSAITASAPGLRPVLLVSASDPRDLAMSLVSPTQNYGTQTLKVYGVRIP